MKKIICILLTILIECSWILNGVTIKASEVSNVVYDEIFISRIFKFKLSGTVVITATGSIPIEQVHAGTIVQSFNPGTLAVSEKKVETTFVKQTSELIHISLKNEMIDSTTNHPFYVLDRGFVKAKDLRAGDILCTVDGDYVVVEQVQHEILESPVNVYNFSVEDNHTYFVGKNGVGVHNGGCGDNSVKPEATVEGSKKHGVNWKEGSSRAKATGKPQGQWSAKDIPFATEKANTLGPGESAYFELPEGAESIVHMPDGTTLLEILK